VGELWAVQESEGLVDSSEATLTAGESACEWSGPTAASGAGAAPGGAETADIAVVDCRREGEW
jgi:hypothetical protein